MAVKLLTLAALIAALGIASVYCQSSDVAAKPEEEAKAVEDAANILLNNNKEGGDSKLGARGQTVISFVRQRKHKNNNNDDNDYNNNNDDDELTDDDKSNNNNNNDYNNNKHDDDWQDNNNNNNNDYNNNDKKVYGSSATVSVPVYQKKEDHSDNKPYQPKKQVYVKKEHVYQQQQQSSSGAYENQGPSHSGLAQVIPANQNQQTLDQIYRRQPSNAYEQPKPYVYQNANTYPRNVRQDILLLLQFGRDFDQWNPRNNNSQWQWDGDASDPADNAAFVVHNGNDYSSSRGAYGGNNNNNNNNNNKWQTENKYGAHNSYKKDDSYVDLITVPFDRYYPLNAPYDEGVVRSKVNYTIGDSQRFLARLKFSCKIINADQHPFPAMLVANSWDDPRLANCNFGLFTPDPTDTLFFYFAVTNTGVWAVSERGSSQANNSNAASPAQEFIAKRRVGVRPRYDTLVDAAVEIDRLQGVVNYYLNGYKVWTVYTIGVPPANDGITSVNLGQGTPQIATINSVVVEFGTMKCLDEADPNNLASRTRLLNLNPGSFFYGANDTFYDPVALRANQLWGQGAKMRLFKLLLVRAESVLPVQTPLPGVYPKAPAYQPEYKANNDYNLYNNNNDHKSEYNQNKNDYDK